MARRLEVRHVALLLGVTAVWGWTFVLVKDAISEFPPVPFLALRFTVALAALALVVRRVPSLKVAASGAAIGAVLAAGYLLQTLGLAHTSPGNAGLITGLFFVFTPLLDRVFGATVGARTLLAVAVALLGTVLLTTGGRTAIGFGDLLVLGCAVCFALQIVLLSRWGPGLPAADLTLVQLAACAVLFTAAGATQFRAPSAGVWLAIVITGIFASALAFFIQTRAQSHLSAPTTALVLATEPAWALLFSVVLAGQRFGLLQGLGAGLLLAGIAGHELPLRRHEARRRHASGHTVKL